MKRIRKGPPPASLVRHQKTVAADYNNYSEKGELRTALLEEQGYLCCYCMGRIYADADAINMKIEHWAPQSKFPFQQLDYKNLLGACLGNEGARLDNQHCDTRKGDAVININPIDSTKNCENLIAYSSNGKISSSDPKIDQDLNETLNLNLNRLKSARKNALFVVLEQLNRNFSGRTWSPTAIRKEIDRLKSPREEKFLPFCQYAIAYLEKRL